MRPIKSNIGTAAYEIVKYLNKLLTPRLSKSDYNIFNTEDLMRRPREEKFSLDIKWLLLTGRSIINVPLDKTVNFTLKKVYDGKKI